MQPYLILSAADLFPAFAFTGFAFIVAMALTPFWTDFLYKNKLGKKIRATDYKGEEAPVFHRLHKGKEGTPTMGGVIIWVVAALITLFFNLDRARTWLPLFTLFAAGLVGAIDDLLNIRGIGSNRGGMRFRYKILIYIILAAIGAWWFYSKLGFSLISIPGAGLFEIGWWYVPLFIFVLMATTVSANETDGLDGLLGGVMAVCFGAYMVIALSQGKNELAYFSATVLGALLAFLWFNIYPARFFMGDTGAVALGMTLGVMAFLTNSVAVLPIIGIVLVAEALSVIIQIFSRKFFKRKVFLSTPLHHHFEALGWPEAKVTMRFWVISLAAAAIGVGVYLLGKL